MAINALHPFNGRHAIQSAAFVVEWATELSPTELRAIRGTYAALQRWFPLATDQNALQINVNDSTGVRTKQQTLIGYAFSKPSTATAQQVAYQIEVLTTRCQVTIFDYTRWKPTWEQVQEWLAILLPAIADGRQIMSMGLQYTDVFKWRADPETLVLEEIFSRESKYVPPNVFQAKTLWHSHHGFFDDRTEPVVHRLLENVNVNCIDENRQRAFAIVTSHRGTLNKPVWGADNVLECARALMPDFHDRNKAILRDLLSAAVQEKIRLSGGQDGA